MTRGSVISRLRRSDASPRSCRAPRALACVLVTIVGLALPATAVAQSPTLQAPAPAGNSSTAPESPTIAKRSRRRATPPQSEPEDEASSKAREADVAAQPKESEDLDVALARPGDLNLHGLSLNAALFTIGEQWNINIVAGELQGSVNGAFKQAPLREILDAILLSNGYNYRAVGKSLVISSVADLGQVNPFFQSATIPVQNADIEEVVQGAQLLTTPKGQVRAMKSARSIVVLDFPDRVKMIREFVNTLDNAGNGRFPSGENRNGVPLEVGYFRTQHISAKTAETALQAVLSKEGRVAVMEKEDRLLVTDYAENMAMIERVLERIDHPRPQVRILAWIYDISLQDVERMGFNWNPTLKGRFDAAGDPQSTLDVESVTTVPIVTGAAGNTMTFTNLSKNMDLTAVVQCIQEAKDARLLADPNVAVLDNEEAILEQVQEIPYQQLTQTQQGGDIGTTAFKKAGITLHVRPKIAADGVIRMEVRPEFSRLTGFTPGDNQPIIATSSASTTLTISNRQLVVIGGLRQRQDVGAFNGVPYLKDMRIVGRLFRSRDIEVRESELLVFIMPEIIPYDDDPNCRQQQAADTLDCRLDQNPVAEGCPPCCRRLPPGALLDPNNYPNYDPNMGAPMNGSPQFGAPAMSEPGVPVEMNNPGPTPQNIEFPAGGTEDVLPAPANVSAPEPMSATQIPSAEFQFGVAGRNEQVRVLIDDGRLRRLPTVSAMSNSSAANGSPIIGHVRVARQFNGTPSATAPAQQPRIAELPASTTPIRR